ncbi:hypothetical protein [Hydrocarboniclastica marina]|uniref:hypothetical protein n=1 Tax=Hydrocarboniclastica marina TaxID=2259620 RepID=UPI001FE479B0|nr:hypothetical protein [Hydrocarboniclastica marina]
MSNKPTRPARPTGKPARKTAPRPSQAPGPVRQPRKLPFLEAVCKKLNQRANLEDEQRLLGLYERGWIFRGVLANLEGDEARYVRSLATRYNSWIARQVA